MVSNLFPFGFGAFAPTVGIGFFVHTETKGKEGLKTRNLVVC